MSQNCVLLMDAWTYLNTYLCILWCSFVEAAANVKNRSLKTTTILSSHIAFGKSKEHEQMKNILIFLLIFDLRKNRKKIEIFMIDMASIQNDLLFCRYFCEAYRKFERRWQTANKVDNRIVKEQMYALFLNVILSIRFVGFNLNESTDCRVQYLFTFF